MGKTTAAAVFLAGGRVFSIFKIYLITYHIAYGIVSCFILSLFLSLSSGGRGKTQAVELTTFSRHNMD